MRRADRLVVGEKVEFPLIMFRGIRSCKLTDHSRARTHPVLLFFPELRIVPDRRIAIHTAGLCVPVFLGKPVLRAVLATPRLPASLYASFRICLFLTARLSADDRRMAVLKAAFEEKTGGFRAITRLQQDD